MADDRRDAPDAKRRRPTTIDLKATEVASEPVNPAEPVEKTAETPRAEPAPEAPRRGTRARAGRAIVAAGMA